MGTIPPQKIPTQEEFERADAADAANQVLLAKLRDHLVKNFWKYAPLHEIYFFGSPGSRLEAYIFYHNEADILKYQANGIEQAMKDSLLEKINSLPEVAGQTTQVEFHFLSHEAVLKKYGGYYPFFR